MKTTNILAIILTAIVPLISQSQPELLKDIANEGFYLNSGPSEFMRAGDNIYFLATYPELYSNVWKTDGTENGTTAAPIDEYLTTFGSLKMIPFGNDLIVNGSSLGSRVYYSDGTATGEVEIMDDHAFDFTYATDAQNSFVINGEIFFWAKRSNDTVGAELYKSDGTAAGTVLFKDFNVGSGKGYAGAVASRHSIQVSDDKAFIIAHDGDSNNLYVTDGTIAGTEYLATLTPNFFTQDPSFYSQIINDHAYIRTTSRIWSVNATNNTLTEMSLPANILIVGGYHMNDKYYALIQDGFAMRDLYEINGSTLTLIADDFATSDGGIYPWSYSTNQCEANDKFYFTVHPATLQNVQLWITDGTEAGTVLANDSIAVSGNGIDRIYTCNDRTYYFQAGSAQTLFEINSSTHALEELLVAPTSVPFLDEETCRFYFGFDDPEVKVEPHYLDMGAPPAPSNLNPPSNLIASAAGRADGKVNLTWQDNSNNESGFYIERSIDSAVFSQITSVGADITFYLDTAGLLADTTYYYRVSAYNATETSSYSNVASVTTYPLSIDETNETRLRVYPNPSNGTFTMDFIGESSDALIIDISGAIVSRLHLKQGPNPIRLALSPGIYFMKSGEITQQIVILKE